MGDRLALGEGEPDRKVRGETDATHSWATSAALRSHDHAVHGIGPTRLGQVSVGGIPIAADHERDVCALQLRADAAQNVLIELVGTDRALQVQVDHEEATANHAADAMQAGTSWVDDRARG
eukprot:7762101-Pyramimonas_sp.AAC.1